MKTWIKISGVLLLLLFFVTGSSAVEKQETWEEVNTRATGLYKEQHFIKAGRVARYAVELARKLPAEEREKLAISLGNLSMIATHLGNFGEAENAAKEELEIREQLHGKENVEPLKAWNHLAIIYTMAQKPDDAEFCLERIISICEQLYGAQSSEVLAALYKLEKFYKISKNKEKEKKTAARIATLESVLDKERQDSKEPVNKEEVKQGS